MADSHSKTSRARTAAIVLATVGPLLLLVTAAQAAHHPLAAAIGGAFAPVSGAIVGPSARDVCSADVLVPVPLRKNGTQDGKRKLKSRAELYAGARDSDALVLVCRPAS